MTRKFEVGARVKVLDTYVNESIRGYTGTIRDGDFGYWDVMVDDDPDENPEDPWTIAQEYLMLWYPEDPKDTEKTVNLDRELLREVLDELEPGSQVWTKLDAIVNAPVTHKFEVTITHQNPILFLDNALVGKGVGVEISRIEG